ncbi:hypothetical protein GBQ70_05990 [Halomicrobium sp. ZPS1]|uniref:Uncharacterized protein n=1 Tax=Halomicrobium mukohataei TaxID=57705 RepID=A0A4D6KGJ7_9EURY|nr:hypothetical protein E5139_05995 [Halomicrobium mukohataei]QFR20017.1 hypothetical protein GBQ70_05990 [Halomicrobium sp. ZPS1]
MVGWVCLIKPREASGLDPEAVHKNLLEGDERARSTGSAATVTRLTLPAITASRHSRPRGREVLYGLPAGSITRTARSRPILGVRAVVRARRVWS